MVIVETDGCYQVMCAHSNNSNVLEESSSSIASSVVISKGKFKGGKLRSIEWFDDKVAACTDKFA